MNDPHPVASARSYLSLCPAEPFRIFFPLGTLAGISGVSLWPLFFSGIHHGFYPGAMHARMMIEGFLGAFIFGFLGTALPRLTGTPHLSRKELWIVLALYIAAIGTHIAERPLAGDAFFLLLLATFTVLMGRRFVQRTDLPPPGFVLIGLGFFNALAGTALLILGAWELWPQASQAGANLLQQGWVLLHILGLGSFLLARFLGLPPTALPESRVPTPEWSRRAMFAGATGVLITLSLVAEALLPWSYAAASVRCLAAASYLLFTVPFYRAAVPNVTLTLSLRIALVMLIAGLIFPLCWPAQRVAGLHVIFLGGFSLVAFTVATRVVLGHSGFSDRFSTRLPFLLATVFFILTATVLRAVGDFLPPARPHWLNGASYLWMLGAMIWAWCVLPKVRIPDSEP